MRSARLRMNDQLASGAAAAGGHDRGGHRGPVAAADHVRARLRRDLRASVPHVEAPRSPTSASTLSTGWLGRRPEGRPGRPHRALGGWHLHIPAAGLAVPVPVWSLSRAGRLRRARRPGGPAAARVPVRAMATAAAACPGRRCLVSGGRAKRGAMWTLAAGVSPHRRHRLLRPHLRPGPRPRRDRRGSLAAAAIGGHARHHRR